MGDRPQSAGSAAVTVRAVRDCAGAAVTDDLTIDELHTYFVGAGDTALLIHNCLNGTSARNLTDHFGWHGHEFGMTSEVEYEEVWVPKTPSAQFGGLGHSRTL